MSAGLLDRGLAAIGLQRIHATSAEPYKAARRSPLTADWAVAVLSADQTSVEVTQVGPAGSDVSVTVNGSVNGVAMTPDAHRLIGSRIEEGKVAGE